MLVFNAQVSAIGKYCYVVPSEDELDFGDQTIVAVGGGGGGGEERGGCPQKEFTLRNQSVVPATFKVRSSTDAAVVISLRTLCSDGRGRSGLLRRRCLCAVFFRGQGTHAVSKVENSFALHDIDVRQP